MPEPFVLMPTSLVPLTPMLWPSGAMRTPPTSTRYRNSNPPMVRCVSIAGIGMRRVVPATRSTMKGRRQAGGARSHATVSGSVLSSADADTNPTTPPSRLIDGLELGRSAWVPSVARLTRVVALVCRSNRKTSVVPLVSPVTRFVASDRNTIQRPSPLIWGAWLDPFDCAPPVPTLTRVVSLVCRSRR